MAKSLDRFFDGTFGGNEQNNEIPPTVAHFFSGLFHFLCRLFWRYEVVNQERLRAFMGKRSGAVLVAPHVSYVDVIILFLTARPKQWVRLMGRDNLFSALGGLLGEVIARVGAFPVTRDSADRTAVKRATRMLKNGEFVGVFPEGTRRGKGSAASELHGGAALIARMGKAPIVPVGLVNLDQVKPKGKRPGFKKITAIIGEPISVSSFDFLPKDERLDACTWYAMREAFALSHGQTPEEVDMVALFPESKDYAPVFAEHPIPRVDVASLPDYEPKA
jgi:1-acyl-sn-glycerol-3-phosphate acyltransferase